jgi:hypothetical protein
VDEVDGLRLEKVLKVHQRGGILAGGDRDTSLPPDPRQAGIVFGRPDRLFEPAQIEWTQFARHIEGFAHRPRAIDVEHDVDVIAGR